MKKYPQGSIWRKWDLQVHSPGGKLYDGYKLKGEADVLDSFCEAIEKSDIQVFGITDYFSFDAFPTFLERFGKRHPKSNKVFFFNLELRLNETVNKAQEEVNIHLIFNSAFHDQIPKFLSKLEVVRTGKNESVITCSELKTPDDFGSATVTRQALNRAFEDTFGKKAIRQDCFIIITAANNDGLRPERGKKRKEGICDEIDKFTDAFFGGTQNVDYYLKTDRYDDGLMAAPKPVIASSDSHSFEDLRNVLGKRHIENQEKDGKSVEIVAKDVTWIKADPTYDGLKQVLYEPKQGERVKLGPVIPDEKDAYKIIRKIYFPGSEDFPHEIEFSGNLSSIIGSRSSGKSALLAYIAHAVEPERIEGLIQGPGQGEDYHWERVGLEHTIEWANGKSNEDSPGRIVYVSQNYLFDKSADAGAIKEEIQPVLFKLLPDFGRLFSQNTSAIETSNERISDSITGWFSVSGAIKTLDDNLKNIGNRAAIESQKGETEIKINVLRDKNALSEADVRKYQSIKEQNAAIENRIKEIDSQLDILGDVSASKGFFSSLRFSPTPSASVLPVPLQKQVQEITEKAQEETLKSANKAVFEYKSSLTKERAEKVAESAKIISGNKALLDKYQKNAELEKLVETSAGYAAALKKIADLESEKQGKIKKLKKAEDTITEVIADRKRLIEELSEKMESEVQDEKVGIKFGMEFGFADGDIEEGIKGLNIKEKTQFVDRNRIKIDEVRSHPGTFLAHLFIEKQKIISGYDKEDVAREVLCLTEEILFSAEMERDKIGGFSESTMTPGKRALFALRLMLAESEDTWPLLIDQPEDDLDSRSIYDEVVPFLKAKKKERQIIMVTHNANLVIGSDSEQIIIANRHGSDRKNEDGKQFNYLTGSLEYSKEHDKTILDTLNAQGVCEHTCAILDGGKAAFENRKNRYHVT